MTITNSMKVVFAACMILALFVTTGDSHAQAFQTNGIGGGNGGGNGAVMINAESFIDNTSGNLLNVAYGGAGIGVLALAVMAFAGRFSWVWFYCILGGLLTIAGLQLGVQYITGEQNVLTNAQNSATVFNGG